MVHTPSPILGGENKYLTSAQYFLHTIRSVIQMKKGEHTQNSHFKHLQSKRFRVSSETPLEVNIDGEHLGEHTNLEYSVLPKALRVIVHPDHYQK
jgi:diacylglycerol kinase family enzyme